REPVVPAYRASVGQAHAQIAEQVTWLDAGEAHRQQHQVAFELALRPLAHRYPPALHFDIGQPQRPDPAGGVRNELLRGHGVDALAALLVRGRDAVDHRIDRPRLVLWPARWRPRQDLQLRDRRGALAQRSAEAVSSGIAAADDHDVPA